MNTEFHSATPCFVVKFLGPKKGKQTTNTGWLLWFITSRQNIAEMGTEK